VANEEHLAILRRGVDAWNVWRRKTGILHPDLSEVDLRSMDLTSADLTGTHLTGAFLNDAKLNNAELTGADLTRASLYGTHVYDANLTDVNLSNANLTNVNLIGANLTRADLSNANLTHAQLVRTDLQDAILNGIRVFGISAWDLNLEGARQDSLVVTPEREPTITVNDLEIAQFIYLLLHNQNVRRVIDTITSKVVLILGNFKRKDFLEAVREELRKRDLLPVIFDFDGPPSQTVRETVGTLARMSRFIVADLSNARSIAGELETIIPVFAVPVQPIFHAGRVTPDGKPEEMHEYGMWRDFPRRYHWALPIFEYVSEEELRASMDTRVIAPAEVKARELRESI